MLSYLQAAVIGLLQGVTEMFPDLQPRLLRARPRPSGRQLGAPRHRVLRLRQRDQPIPRVHRLFETRTLTPFAIYCLVAGVTRIIRFA